MIIFLAQIDTMMQQLDPTWNPHQKLEFFKLCVRTTLSQLGQITSSMEKQEHQLLETTLGNLYRWKEEIVIAPPGQTAKGLMIYIYSTVEIVKILKRYHCGSQVKGPHLTLGDPPFYS